MILPRYSASRFGLLVATLVALGSSAVQGADDSEEIGAFGHEHASVESFDGVLTDVLREVLASPYVDEKKWGRKKNLTVGVRLERDGIVVRPRRRRKQVNHGEWERYEIRLDPNHRDDLKLQTAAVRRGSETKAGHGVEVDARLELPLTMQGRFANWRRGVQLYSIELHASAVAKVDFTARVEAVVHTSTFPPHVELRPRVTRINVELVDFRLHKVSNIQGSLVRPLGKLLEDVANRQLKKRQEKLVEKVNRKLDQKFSSR